MSLYITSNASSLNAQVNLSSSTNSLNKLEEQLSSGYRINHASDDAAGLEIATGLDSQVRGANQAISNSQNGNALLSVADGVLSSVTDNLQRIRELVVEAADGSQGTTQIASIKQEITARVAEINQSTKGAQFNGKNILSSSNTSFKLQIGGNNVASLNTLNIGSALGSATASGLGLSSFSLSTNSQALTTLGNVDKAIAAVGTKRSSIGAFQNRLASIISNLQTTSENFSSAEAGIKDTNIASASAQLSQFQILQQAGASILSQANQAPQIALKLLQ